MEWAAWFENTEKRRVAFDDLGSGVEVCTVFLGLDHSFTLGYPPVLWETLVFGGPLDGEMERYSSRQEAEAGHREMVDRAKKAADAGQPEPEGP